MAVGVLRGFWAWRGERPFWAGLFTLTAGLPVLYFPYTHLDLQGVALALSTTSGATSLIIGVLLVVLGVSLWFQPHMRVFAGVATLLLSLISLPLANFGGLFLGLICGLVGGSLACAWTPPEGAAERLPTRNPADAALPAAQDEGGTGGAGRSCAVCSPDGRTADPYDRPA
ncbi:DUF6114 domain-containing protein [Streptomyces sp. NPDC047079]|uniref:DUF6114 domain-containing protein n=1 Tax=Streptomyces sp. NPDC047079 TaxID=3154607 RepID=UPI0033F8F938